MEENKATNPDLRDATKSDKKNNKVSSKLFAFLSCCSSSNVDPEDAAVPPKKTPRRPSVPQTQPTPEKAEVTAGDSSTAESKEPSSFRGDEKPHATVTPDQAPSPVDEEQPTVEKTPEPRSQVDGAVSSAEQPESVSQPPPKEVESQGPPETSNEPTATGAVPEKTEEQTQQPEDNQTSVPPPTHDDRAEEVPGDNDAATAPATDDEVGPKDEKFPAHEEDAMKLPAVLPPPPPLVHSGKQPQVGNDRQQQQWLLPPPLPHLQNRKCLVLDLDETLVHSSFKV